MNNPRLIIGAIGAAVAAGILGYSAFAEKSGETVPVFDPSRPAVVTEIFPRSVTAPEVFSSRTEMYVELTQCPDPSECVTAQYPLDNLGAVAINDTIVITPDD